MDHAAEHGAYGALPKQQDSSRIVASGTGQRSFDAAGGRRQDRQQVRYQLTKALGSSLLRAPHRASLLKAKAKRHEDYPESTVEEL